MKNRKCLTVQIADWQQQQKWKQQQRKYRKKETGSMHLRLRKIGSNQTLCTVIWSSSKGTNAHMYTFVCKYIHTFTKLICSHLSTLIVLSIHQSNISVIFTLDFQVATEQQQQHKTSENCKLK